MKDFAKRVAHRYYRILLAMSLQEAKEALGFPSGYEPTPEEVNKAYRQKAFEVHPDRGGDSKKMVELNVAKDILEGKSRASGGFGQEDVGSAYSSPTRKSEPVRVSFAEAKQNAGVPHVDKWVFRTAVAYSGYGDTSSSGCVVCGKTGEDAYIFVTIESYSSRNAFTGEDIDAWWMNWKPFRGTLKDVAPGAIRKMWEFPHMKKGYNAKVVLLPDDFKLTEKMFYSPSKSISFKDAMDILGEIPEGDKWKNRKITVQLVIGGNYGSEVLELVLNGRTYELKPESFDFIKKNRVMSEVFGRNRFLGAKKLLTKAKNGKKVMEFMAEKLTHEPQELRDALAAAAAQM